MRFDIIKDESGYYRWRMFDATGKIEARSVPYARESAARRRIGEIVAAIAAGRVEVCETLAEGQA